jgi:hypothetical protein
MTSDRRPEGQTTFLNVDLELSLIEGIDILLQALQPDLFDLNPSHEAGFVILELASGGAKTVEATVMAMIAAVNRLSLPAREIWDRCESRSFNIGIEAAGTPHSCEFKLSRNATAALAGIGAEVTFTVYAARLPTNG